MKNNISDRIRVTKTGKILRRPMGIGHSRSKKTGQARQQLRKNIGVNSIDIRMFKRYS